jgi:hypothetical protein
MIRSLEGVQPAVSNSRGSKLTRAWVPLALLAYADGKGGRVSRCHAAGSASKACATEECIALHSQQRSKRTALVNPP